MALSYKVVPDGLTAYGVEVPGEGRFLSVRGFSSAADARAWIAAQEAAFAAERATRKPEAQT